MTTRIIETHCHPVGASPVTENLGDKIKTLADKISLNSRYPEILRGRIDLDPVDITDDLIKTMDKHGVSHAIIQQTTGKASDDLVAETVKKHPDRFFGLLKLQRTSDITNHPPSEEELPYYRARAAEEVIRGVEKLGLIGVGEFFTRGFTIETQPEKIARDMKPVMDVVAKYEIPIQIQTAWTQFPHTLFYGDPVWVDEIAYEYPKVPVILTKMGRSTHHFETALMVALRNVNVYFDIVDSCPEHIRRAVDGIGADRIMFGTDWCPTTRWISQPMDCYSTHKKLLDDAGLTPSQREQIEWKTAVKVFRLNLK